MLFNASSTYIDKCVRQPRDGLESKRTSCALVAASKLIFTFNDVAVPVVFLELCGFLSVSAFPAEPVLLWLSCATESIDADVTDSDISDETALFDSATDDAPELLEVEVLPPHAAIGKHRVAINNKDKMRRVIFLFSTLFISLQ